jgi:uncharacterized membrane protein (UPF0182 family)
MWTRQLCSLQVMLFKGFSVLTNLGYETAVPQRSDEMITSIITQNVKVIIDAYILGTLFHYLVKKDPEVEAAREVMQGLRRYCKDRSIPNELTQKMEAYLIFQQQHSSSVSRHIIQVLLFITHLRASRIQNQFALIVCPNAVKIC